MGKTFVTVRDPFALPARQRKAGVHKRERFNEYVDHDSYLTFHCEHCNGRAVFPSWEIQEREKEVICPICREIIQIG